MKKIWYGFLIFIFATQFAMARDIRRNPEIRSFKQYLYNYGNYRSREKINSFRFRKRLFLHPDYNTNDLIRWRIHRNKDRTIVRDYYPFIEDDSDSTLCGTKPMTENEQERGKFECKKCLTSGCWK